MAIDTWVKVGYYYPMHAGRIDLSHRVFWNIFEKCKEDPKELAGFLESLLDFYTKGGLKGLVIYSILPSHTHAYIYVHAIHRSFPEVNEGEELPKINLNLTIDDVIMFAESQTFGEDVSDISDVAEFASTPLDPSEA